MIRRQSLLKASLVAVFVLSLSTTAFAQATRTWVSGVGDDVNPCSRTAPCKTFQGAISKTATNGEISVLDPGGFGALTITKGITINGRGTLASVLAAGTNGIIVNTTDRVVIHDITFQGANSGLSAIRIIAAGEVIIDNCEMMGWTQAGITIATSANTKVDVHHSSIYNNFTVNANGISSTPTGGTANVVVADSRISGNNDRGIYAGNGTVLTVQNSTISNNGRGVHVEQGAGQTFAFIDNCIINQNGTGLRNGVGNPHTTLRGTSIEANNIGIDYAAGVIYSYGNNYVSGNSSNNAGGFTAVAPQ